MNRKKRENLILDAAIRVFSRQGYGKSSVSEIIKEARVARGTFYLYFKSKKDLLHILLDRFLLAVSQDIAKIRSSGHSSHRGIKKEFRWLASDLISTLSKNRALAKLIFSNPHGLEGDGDARLALFFDQIVHLIRSNLDLGAQLGRFRPCQSEVAARCMIGSVKEIVSHWVLHQEAEMELEPTIEALIDYLVNGLAPVPLEDKIPGTPEEPVILSRHTSNIH